MKQAICAGPSIRCWESQAKSDLASAVEGPMMICVPEWTKTKARIHPITTTPEHITLLPHHSLPGLVNVAWKGGSGE